MNLVILTGKVCGRPTESKTRRGNVVVAFYINVGARRESVLEVMAFGDLARKVTQNVTAGLHVVVFGRIERDTHAERDDCRIVAQEYFVGHGRALPAAPALVPELV